LNQEKKYKNKAYKAELLEREEDEPDVKQGYREEER
jgi:hypothetical protein